MFNFDDEGLAAADKEGPPRTCSSQAGYNGKWKTRRVRTRRIGDKHCITTGSSGPKWPPRPEDTSCFSNPPYHHGTLEARRLHLVAWETIKSIESSKTRASKGPSSSHEHFTLSSRSRNTSCCQLASPFSAESMDGSALQAPSGTAVSPLTSLDV